MLIYFFFLVVSAVRGVERSFLSDLPNKTNHSSFFFFRVLMLRRKAAPTQTELHLEYSQMVNEALELIAVDLHSKGTSDASTSLDPHAHVDAQP